MRVNSSQLLLTVFLIQLISSCKKDNEDNPSSLPGGSGSGCGAGSTITDIDGNVYATVQIGGRCWMATNLRTTRYRDGSLIPNTMDGADWVQLEGASAVYGDVAANAAVYGVLYNWYAVADERDICPIGSHVPTDEEWKQLETALGMPAGELHSIDWRGGAQNVGGKLKATDLWNGPNTGATNQSGFSGQPGGYLGSCDGCFFGFGEVGHWWSATEDSPIGAWTRTLYYEDAGISRNPSSKTNGFCLRCLLN